MLMQLWVHMPAGSSMNMSQISWDCAAGNPKNDRNGPVDEAAGSANSYLALAALNAAAALPLALAPHTVADFLFGAAALPHDFLHEPLLRILATGFAGASTAAASLNVSAV